MDVFQEASAHFDAEGGIKRSYVHDYGATHDDPVGLFLLAMAWGFGEVGYGPFRATEILAQEGAEYKISHIVTETRTNGAANARQSRRVSSHHDCRACPGSIPGDWPEGLAVGRLGLRFVSPR